MSAVLSKLDSRPQKLDDSKDLANGTVVRARQMIEDNNIEYLRFTYVCNDGVPRSKTSYIDHSASPVALPTHVGLSVTEQLVTELDDAVIDRPPIASVGDIRLIPDWNSSRLIPYRQGHGRVFGPITDGSGRRWPLCPRSFLEEVVDRAAQMDISFSVAFENEFYFLRKNGDAFEPIDASVYAQDEAFSSASNILEPISHALARSGVTPVTLHPESGSGQFEISISPSAPLKAADDQIVLRSTVRDMAADGGLMATFLPRPVNKQSSSGAHINISIWNGGKNITGVGDHLSDVAGHFLAGVISHLPALVSITCPLESSYERLRPGMWSGAFGCWGMSNREAAIRVPYFKGGEVTRIEYRCGDPSANPYLSLGAIISAGLDGIDQALALPPEVNMDLPRLSPRQLRREGVELLPQSLDVALLHLADDVSLRERMGWQLHETYIAVRKEQYRRLRRLKAKDRLRVLLHRF